MRASDFIVIMSGGGANVGGDVSAPTILSLSPADNATGVALNAQFVITFDENVFEGDDFDFSLWKVGEMAASIEWGSAALGSSAFISGTTVTLQQEIQVLSEGDEFYILAGSTAVKDAAGNHFAGIPDETTWSFTAVVTAPTMNFSLAANSQLLAVLADDPF